MKTNTELCVPMPRKRMSTIKPNHLFFIVNACIIPLLVHLLQFRGALQQRYRTSLTQTEAMELSREDKLAQLEKILHSRVLQGSESLRAFLRYAVTKVLDEQESYLKEYTIATEVFGRSSRYDSRSDSVVRVQAGRLRQKLQEYYAGEGKEDQILIDLPKGQYAPTFSLVYNTNGKAGLTNLIWKDFLASPDPILVAFSNTLFEGTAETGMKLLKPLDSAGNSTASPASLQNTPHLSPNIITEHYTGIGEVMGIYFLGDLFYKAGHSIRVKRSLLLTWDDVKINNIVFLGSPAEIFLLRDLPQEQDFVFQFVQDENDESNFGILNTKPGAGEQKFYLAKQEGPSRSQISEDYAVISCLKGLDPHNRVMILAGITTFGTQAAAEYVSKPEYLEDLIRHLNIAPDASAFKVPDYYQMLIKVKVNGGVPVQISYVTHHTL